MRRAIPMLALVAGVAFGCSSSPGSSDGDPEAQLFIAAVSDFVGFGSWQSWAFDSSGTTDGLTHVSGHRVVYLNHAPPHGASVFPVGTIIVKTIQPDAGATGPDGGAAPPQTFAMAKRGGNYNSNGAPGWEWFELEPTQPDTMPEIRWRGVAPPVGENYSGSANGTCNDCHGAATTNDSVLATQLSLAGF